MNFNVIKCIHRSFMFKLYYKNSKNVSTSSDVVQFFHIYQPDDGDNLKDEASVYTFYY